VSGYGFCGDAAVCDLCGDTTGYGLCGDTVVVVCVEIEQVMVFVEI